MSGHKPTWKAETVTPEQAKTMLDAEGIDPAAYTRARGKTILGDYAEDMRTGRWMLNGDALIFDVDGRLLDGRARLVASVASNTPLPTFTVRGVSPDVAVTIDSHRKRRTADVLHISGMDGSIDVASTANAIVSIANGTRMNGERMRASVIKGFVSANPAIMDAMDTANAMTIPVNSPSMMAAMVYLTRLIDKEKSKLFFEGLQATFDMTVEEHQDKKPYFALARAMRGMRKNDVSIPKQRQYLQVYFVKAWNAFMAGAQVSVLHWVDGEAIPVLDGFDPATLAMGEPPPPPEKEVAKAYTAAVHGSEVTLSIKTIMPAQAEEMLENNGPLLDSQQRNRRLLDKTVDMYARDMGKDRWRLNGQSVKISANGRLLDGQHRLSACVRSQKPFETMVVEGLPDDVFSTFDLHAKRQFSATIARLGYQNPKILQGILRIVWQYENHGLGSTLYPTQTELNETLKIHGGRVAPSVAYATQQSVRSLTTDVVIGATHYILTSLNPTLASRFFEDFETGANLSSGHPILALRRRFIEDRKNRRASSERDKLVFITRAWNAFLKGKTVENFKKGGGFERPFDVPQPIGVVDGQIRLAV